MIITLIAIGILILSIILIVLCEKVIINDYIIEDISVGLLIVGIIASLLIGTVIFATHIGIENSIYNSKLERESLVKRVECINSNYEDVSKSDVIKDVYEWNKMVHNAQYWSNNPWTSWFWSQKYVDSLEYIELITVEDISIMDMGEE